MSGVSFACYFVAANAVPMCTHVVCHFLVKRRERTDMRTLGDAHFCEVPPSETGLEREEPMRRRALECRRKARKQQRPNDEKSARGRWPRRRRRLVGDDEGKAVTR